MPAFDPDSRIFVVGSINEPGPWFHPSGEGISVYSLDGRSGAIQRVGGFPQAANAVWLAPRPGGILLATERFTEAGEIRSFDFDGESRLCPAGAAQSSKGGAVCHIAMHPAKPLAFVSSFLGGLTLHAIGKNGEIAPAHQHIKYAGQGHRPMQDRSHPHQATVTPDGKHLFVCDLGADKIWIHGIQADEGHVGDIHIGGGNITLGPAAAIDTPSGSGPRHLVFHPRLPVLYLLGQLDAQVYVYAYAAGILELQTKHPCLPAGFQDDAEAAAIKLHPSGKALYVSERRSNTITVFAIEDGGRPNRVSSFSTMGRTPRDFLISPDGNWMIVLNQDSDTMVPFSLNPLNGMPHESRGEPVVAGCPVCGFFWNE